MIDRLIYAQNGSRSATRIVRTACHVLVALALCAAVGPAIAAAGEPTLRDVNIRGLQIAGTTTLVISGDNLGLQPKLVLPFAAKQEIKPGSNDKRATIDVTLAADVAPGIYNMWLVSSGGCSLPVLMAVDRLPQRVVSAATETPPVALHGVVSGSATTEIKLNGQAGEALMVEIDAQRLASKLRPIVHLYGPNRLQIAWSWGSPLLAGDTRLQATLPSTGVYTIAIHDAEYAAAAPSFFRLKLGQWSAIDQVFPPVVPAGKSVSVELLGPGVDLSIKVPESKRAASAPLPWPAAGTWSGPRPFVEYRTLPELIEQKSKNPAQDLPAGPVAVSGRLLVPGEEDRYRVAVAPGSKLRLEVFAERYGSPLDTSIVIRNDQGAVLAQSLDSPGTLDPLLEYTVPAKIDTLVVGVVDAQLRGGPKGIYRLAIEPTTAEPPQDFALSTVTQRLSLGSGGRHLLPILVDRRGYQGPIEITATGLPSGVWIEGTTIPANADGTLVTVMRDEAADKATPLVAVTSTWQGRVLREGATAGLVRPVNLQGHPLERLQPWLATELEVAPSDSKAADFDLDWGALPSDARLVLAGKLALPVKVKRSDEKAPVRLSLITSQIVPLLNARPVPTKTLRVEKDVELGAKQEAGELTLLVPAELSGPVYDVTVQAELLSTDKRTVLATVVAPVKRLEVLNPLNVRVAGPTPIPVTLTKTGAVVKLAGKIERQRGLTGDVTVSFTGLPPGAKAAAAVVKGDKVDFTTNLVLAPNTPLGEHKGFKLSATAIPDPKQPQIRVRSADLELVLLVQPETAKAK